MSAILVKQEEITASENVIPIYVVRDNEWPQFKLSLSESHIKFSEIQKFSAKTDQKLCLTSSDGEILSVIFGAGSKSTDDLGAMRAGGLSASLPSGFYRFSLLPKDWKQDLAIVGWGAGAYKFEEYLPTETIFPTLVIDQYDKLEEIRSTVDAIHLCRNLINTPANDMGPDALGETVIKIAELHGAAIKITKGKDLITEKYPMVHAVGRAAHEEPRLVEFEWGETSHPRLAIVGKGITFDTGGLNIKSAAGAKIMKKDMGGAAHALALSKMIMANNLPVRLHCLIAIAENSISAGAYRPGDILTSRSGLTIEIDNTDAEGRLVLADALTKASELEPNLIMDFATLTGAARVALGPTLPPFYCNREAPVSSVLEHSKKQKDPMWHMPLWQQYNQMLISPIADMKNAGGGFAGSITAALFLERFVNAHPWMHFDVYGWCPTSYPGHPKGGDMFAVRSLYHWIKSGGLNSNLSI
jgi:leucyl aminopeptidase